MERRRLNVLRLIVAVDGGALDERVPRAENGAST